MAEWTAVVLTGGRSTRMGQDKAATRIAGRTLLQRVVTAVPDAAEIVIVGPEQRVGLPVEVRWTCEEPPGGGPVAGLLAALPLVRTPVLVALATDLPFLGGMPRRLVERLTRAEVDAVIPVDATGRDQPLCAAYRTAVLRSVAADLGNPAGMPMHALLRALRGDRFRPPVTTVDPTTDVDTPADLARARGALAMQDWIEAVRRELATAGELDVQAVLDVARDVAHNVQRPAAPVTTYLLGLAVGSGMPLGVAAAKIQELATGWSAEQ